MLGTGVYTPICDYYRGNYTGSILWILCGWTGPKRHRKRHVIRPRKRIPLRIRKPSPRPRNTVRGPAPKIPFPIAVDGLDEEEVLAVVGREDILVGLVW
jgi:hypothetical protein